MSATQGAKEPTIEYSDSTLTRPAGDDAYGDRSVYGKNPNPDNDTTSYGRDTNVNTSALDGSSSNQTSGHSHHSHNTSNLATGAAGAGLASSATHSHDHDHHHHSGAAPGAGAAGVGGGLLSTGTSGYTQEANHISHSGDSALHNQQHNAGVHNPAYENQTRPFDSNNFNPNERELSTTERNLHNHGHEHAADRVAAGGLGTATAAGLTQHDHKTGNFQNQSVPPSGQALNSADHGVAQTGLKSDYDKLGNRVGAGHVEGTNYEQEHPDIHNDSNKSTGIVDKIKAKMHM